MQTPFVTYRFLDINKLDMKSVYFPVHPYWDYLGEHVKGALDASILDVCECKCDDMKWSFDESLFVFRTGVPVRDEHTARKMYVPDGDFVNIYVMKMDRDMKEAYMNTMFDSMMKEMHRQWNIMGKSHQQRKAIMEVIFNSKCKWHYNVWFDKGCKYFPPSWFSEIQELVAKKEGVRRAHIISADEFMRQAW
jgi:hypothetical protein